MTLEAKSNCVHNIQLQKLTRTEPASGLIFTNMHEILFAKYITLDAPYLLTIISV